MALWRTSTASLPPKDAFFIIWSLGMATIVEACHMCSRTDSGHKMAAWLGKLSRFSNIFFKQIQNVGCFHKNAVNKETCRISVRFAGLLTAISCLDACPCYSI